MPGGRLCLPCPAHWLLATDMLVASSTRHLVGALHHEAAIGTQALRQRGKHR